MKKNIYYVGILVHSETYCQDRNSLCQIWIMLMRTVLNKSGMFTFFTKKIFLTLHSWVFFSRMESCLCSANLKQTVQSNIPFITNCWCFESIHILDYIVIAQNKSNQWKKSNINDYIEAWQRAKCRMENGNIHRKSNDQLDGTVRSKRMYIFIITLS